MNLGAEDLGAVLLCDRDGVIVRVVRDDLALAARMRPGSPLIGVAADDVQEKASRFLAELQARAAAYDWEITVPVGGRFVPLHFAGAKVDDGFLVVIAYTRRGLTELNEELMLINNEQTNALRAALKEISLQSQRAPIDGHFYDDLSRLNNDLANLQREMVKKNVELEKLSEQKNHFLGMAAHDLRSPLGIILSYSEFLESELGGSLDKEQREFITTIKDTSQFMLHLVDDLLDVTTIESGRLNLDLHSADVTHLIQRNVALNRTLATKKQIVVECELPAAPVLVAIDSGKIEQVLNNLIGNAVKFSHPGTTVRVRLALGSDAVTIEVQDQGQGIPTEDLPKLFTAFGKTKVRPTAGEQSTGLGLAICRKIVEGHGGRIQVRSTVGQGSTFFFTLPLTVSRTSMEQRS